MRFVSIILLLLLSIRTSAQMTLTGDFIPRAEYRHGFKNMPDSNQAAAGFMSQRARLIYGYKHEAYTIGFSIQDVRVWGSTPQLNLSDDFLSVHEAWGEFRIAEKLGLKLGRQEIIFDDHRIFGSVDWAQQARSHDVGILKYSDSTLQIQAGFAYNQESEQLKGNVYNLKGNYKVLDFLWINKQWGNLSMSALLLGNGVQGTQLEADSTLKYLTYFSNTIGTHIIYKTGKINMRFNSYYQGGVNGGGKDLSASNLGLDVSYQMTENIKFTLGYEMISGTSQTDTANKSDNSFTPFYGTNHKFNGLMDYFYVGNHIGSVGLNDIYGKLNFKKDKLSAGMDFHLFSAAADVLDKSELTKIAAMDASLGSEIDVYAGFQISKPVNLQLGYSQFFGTKTLQAIRGGKLEETANWAWFMIRIKPDFLN